MLFTHQWQNLNYLKLAWNFARVHPVCVQDFSKVAMAHEFKSRVQLLVSWLECNLDKRDTEDEAAWFSLYSIYLCCLPLSSPPDK